MDGDADSVLLGDMAPPPTAEMDDSTIDEPISATLVCCFVAWPCIIFCRLFYFIVVIVHGKHARTKWRYSLHACRPPYMCMQCAKMNTAFFKSPSCLLLASRCAGCDAQAVARAAASALTHPAARLWVTSSHCTFRSMSLGDLWGPMILCITLALLVVVLLYFTRHQFNFLLIIHESKEYGLI